MRALLDVNVLIALLDRAHVAHKVAMRWMASQLTHGWASCPLTQNGCIRVMSQPAYGGNFVAAQVAAQLSAATTASAHEFWPADLSLLEAGVLDWSHVLGHRQVTDNYLLALAVRHQGRLVSFDSGIALSAVRGARSTHLVLLR